MRVNTMSTDFEVATPAASVQSGTPLPVICTRGHASRFDRAPSCLADFRDIFFGTLAVVPSGFSGVS